MRRTTITLVVARALLSAVNCKRGDRRSLASLASAAAVLVARFRSALLRGV